MCAVTGRLSALWHPFVALLIVVTQPVQSAGQAIRGTIRDTVTNLAVTSARVAMLDRPGDTVATAISGEAGTFLLRAPHWGTFVISIRRLGYQPLVRPPVELIPGDTVEIAYHMHRLPVSMEPVLVEAEAVAQLAHVRYLHREGFYRRQTRSYAGRFLDPVAIERRRDFAIRADDYLIGQAHVTRLSRSRLGYRLRCGRPRLFVDGRLFIGDELDQVLDPADVLAMEIYDGSYMYIPDYGGCSIVVWTKSGAEEDVRPD